MWKPTNKSSTATSVRVSLSLSEALHDHFAERAAKHGHSVEEELVDRLTVCRDFTSTTPIYLDDQARNDLSQIAGKTIQTPADLLEWARSVSTLTVEGTNIPLSERLLKRLDTRRFGLTMPEYLNRTVTESLEEKVGLR